MSNNDIVQLEAKDVAATRDRILGAQGGCCAICGDKISVKSGACLDHQHKLKKDVPGIDGGGLVRGVLCRSCNTWEGKVWNSATRFKKPSSVAERIKLVESLLAYYESGTWPLIHPREKPREPNVSKSQYNKLKKLYGGKKVFPPYPASKKLGKRLGELFSEYGVSPFKN